jgi:hypothetical protein
LRKISLKKVVSFSRFSLKGEAWRFLANSARSHPVRALNRFCSISYSVEIWKRNKQQHSSPYLQPSFTSCFWQRSKEQKISVTSVYLCFYFSFLKKEENLASKVFSVSEFLIICKTVIRLFDF